MSYRMHDLSNALRAVSRNLPSSKKDARRIIVKLCTKSVREDGEDKYPWQVKFESGSIERTYGAYTTFHEYLSEWSSMTWQDFRDWFRDDDEVADLLDAAVKGRQGERTDLVDNIHEVTERPTGTSKDATLRRLRKDRPDLLEKVKAGDLTANAAAIEAGFRKPSRTVPIDTPEHAVKALLRVFTAEELLDALGPHRPQPTATIDTSEEYTSQPGLFDQRQEKH